MPRSYHRPGIPLFDLTATGKKGGDSRMYFSWYAADYCTDPEFENLSPEDRANPSRSSWADDGYLAQQQSRLPAHKYRRLHLNLPGLPEGSAFNVEKVMDSIDRGVKVRPYAPQLQYFAFVDMSGGSNDDAVLAIAHRDADGKAVLDRIMNQGQRPPFNPLVAIELFVAVLDEYRIRNVTGDKYAGETFRAAFGDRGIHYQVAELTASQLYESMEPKLNSGQIILLDEPKLEQQLLGLIWRGGKIDHPVGDHEIIRMLLPES